MTPPRTAADHSGGLAAGSFPAAFQTAVVGRDGRLRFIPNSSRASAGPVVQGVQDVSGRVWR